MFASGRFRRSYATVKDVAVLDRKDQHWSLCKVRKLALLVNFPKSMYRLSKHVYAEFLCRIGK